MYKYFTGIILIVFAANRSSAQNPFELGGEYIKMIGKGYSTAKAAVRGETFSNKNSFSAGITYNLASSKSYSVSRGFGFYLGYRYSFSNKLTGNTPFAGARVLFSLEDFEGKGRDKSLLLTPFAEAGYHFVFAKSFFAAPAVGFGYTVEFTKGYNSLDEDRGQRIVPSLSAGYRF